MKHDGSLNRHHPCGEREAGGFEVCLRGRSDRTLYVFGFV